MAGETTQTLDVAPMPACIGVLLLLYVLDSMCPLCCFYLGSMCVYVVYVFACCFYVVSSLVSPAEKELPCIGKRVHVRCTGRPRIEHT